MNEHVVLVHGLWMRGPEMALLRWRLRRCGFTTSQFSYSSLRCGLAEAAARLGRHIQAQDAGVIHLVGHSLGGLVIRRLLLDFPQHQQLRPGRVVTLGTPHQGSYVAARISQLAAGEWLLGKSAQSLTDSLPPWGGSRELGVIAGSLALGVGQVVPGLVQPNDGTVSVAEACLPGATDQRVLPVSHMGLLVSADVARQVCAFLKNGHFV
jgi:pimeloyl-ACP methyl ester carboxylesterase